MHVPRGSNQFSDASRRCEEYNTGCLAGLVSAVAVVPGLGFTRDRRYQSWQRWLDVSGCLANHPRLSSCSPERHQMLEMSPSLLFFFFTTSKSCLSENGTHYEHNIAGKSVSVRDLTLKYCKEWRLWGVTLTFSLVSGAHYLHQWFGKGGVRS